MNREIEDALPEADVVVTREGDLFVEEQRRLLTEPFRRSWSGHDGGPFTALANVGIFITYKHPPVVPDVLITVGDAWPSDFAAGELPYLMWVVGKMPDVVIEIVAGADGGEDTTKLKTYAQMGVPNYVIYDPCCNLSKDRVKAFVRMARTYEPIAPDWFPDVGLGLKLWDGKFEKRGGSWLRWCSRTGRLIPTDEEHAQERSGDSKDSWRAERFVAFSTEKGIDAPS